MKLVIIPNILKSAINSDKTFKIFGDDYDTPDGTCIRDYVNVEDLAVAHKLAYEYLIRENISNVFNIGTEQGVSVKSIFHECEKITGKKIPIEIVERRPGDSAILCANTNKAKNILKWKPAKTITESILSAYKWEKSSIHKKDCQ